MGRKSVQLRKRRGKGSKAERIDPTTNNHRMDGLRNNGPNSSDNAPPLINGDGVDLGSESATAVGDLPKKQHELVSSLPAMFDSVTGSHQTAQPLNSEKSGSSRHHNSHSHESIASTASSGAYTDEDAVITAYNVHSAIEQMHTLKGDARIMAAAKLARKVEDFLENAMASTGTSGFDAHALHSSHKGEFDDLYVNEKAFNSILEEDTSDNWNYSHAFRGITTHFRVDNKLLWLKVSGDMNGATVFDQLVTIREADLYDTWFPMCSQSKLVTKLGKAALIIHFTMSLPGVSRDAVVYASACDASIERDCLIVKGYSVDQWGGIELPRASNSFLSKRMVVHAFNSSFEFAGPSRVRTNLVICIDPKTPLPPNIANYLVRKIGGMILHAMVKNACRISVDPNALHRDLVLQDEEFYKDWIIPRVETIYALRDWEFKGPAWLLDDAQENEEVCYDDEVKGGLQLPEERDGTALSNIQECGGETSTTAHGKKHWRKRFKRKVSAAAKKVRMKRKSRKGGETNHLIKEETDVTSPAVCVPHPECKLDEIVLDGSFKASDIVSVPLHYYRAHTLSTESNWKFILAKVAEGILRFGIAQFFWQILASAAWTVAETRPHLKQKYTRAFMMHYIRCAEMGWSGMVWLISVAFCALLLAHYKKLTHKPTL